MLYVGLEHGLMSNVRLANSFFNQAHSLAPDDPFVLHELGSVAYQNGDYQLAEKCYLQAVDMVGRLQRASSESFSGDQPVDDTWEPLLNNLGHVSRKLKKYDLAIEYHQKALLVSPMRSNTYAALGYVNALMNNAGQAVEYFQKALALKRDDTFSTTMLNSVLESYLNEDPPFNGTILSRCIYLLVIFHKEIATGAPTEVPPPTKIVPETPAGLSATPSDRQSLRLGASTSNMEMSSSMADISEEDGLQMDSPGFFQLASAGLSTLNKIFLLFFKNFIIFHFIDSKAEDSVLSGIGPLRTPSDMITPTTTTAGGNPGCSTGYGFRPGELGQRLGANRPAEMNEEDISTDEDTPNRRK